jgi:hypothetical protein
MSDQEDPDTEQGDSGSTDGGHDVTSYNQRGGITAGELNVGSQPRRLGSKTKSQFLEKIAKDADIKLTVPVGDGEALQLAEQIVRFLEKNGYESVREGINRVVKTEPEQGIVVYTKPHEADYEIHVGRK